MQIINIAGKQWIKGYLYYNKPFLNLAEINHDGKETPLHGFMRLDEIEANEPITCIYETLEEIKENEL